MKLPDITDKDTERLIEQIQLRAKTSRKTIATAESCTGGLLAAFLTQLPGSSEVFLGGVSAYSNHAKIKILGVNEKTIGDFGAVSQETAKAMAEKTRSSLNSSIGISITGIAGPDGATPGKPVGTVWIGVHTAQESSARLFTFSGTRHEVRYQAAVAALKEIERVI